MSNILHHLPPSVRGMLYVDDLQVSYQGSDMRLIERQLQTTVNRLVKWCDQNGHTISPFKSSCVHFCRKRNLHPDPSIHIGNIQIPVVSAVRFLGIIFDSKLTFLPHVLYLRKKCERSLNILKVLSNTLWGADRVSLLRVYQALILSRLDYGCVVYGSARASVLKRLDTVHHCSENLRWCLQNFACYQLVCGQETWDQQVLNKLHSIHPSTSHWAALPVRRHDVRLSRLRIGYTRFTHRHLLLVSAWNPNYENVVKPHYKLNANPPTSKSIYQWERALKKAGTLVSQTGKYPRVFSGRGSRVVKLSDRGWPCYEFESSNTKDSPCRGLMHVKSVESSNVFPLVW
ncbi:putative RNA-directed DNA polymerase from transposon X-element [Trichonephila clavipes]|nr:putative RNA-directed DNA polymerase from transposon X-element [Trichonephila clavipes]